MKNKCLFCFLTILILIDKFSFIRSVTNINEKEISKNKVNSNTLVDELLKLINEENKEENQSEDDILGSTSNFIETSNQSIERGTGCEAMSKCSGKGTCNSGVCVCDEGYDYFDCSINVLSKINLVNNFRKVSQ